MFYLTGDGRLCAYAMVTREGKIAMGVPQTDIEDVKQSAKADFVTGFDDEVGLIHSVAHFFKHFELNIVRPGISENEVAAAADDAMRQAGAIDFYRSYVASGPRTNIAHGLPSLRNIEKMVLESNLKRHLYLPGTHFSMVSASSFTKECGDCCRKL
jgi:hypothetical protein